MTSWVNDLQRRIYFAIQGWDVLPEEECAKVVWRAERWSGYGLGG